MFYFLYSMYVFGSFLDHVPIICWVVVLICVFFFFFLIFRRRIKKKRKVWICLRTKYWVIILFCLVSSKICTIRKLEASYELRSIDTDTRHGYDMTRTLWHVLFKNQRHKHDKDTFIKMYIIFIQEGNSKSVSLCI